MKLAAVLAQLSEDEATAVYNALAQWADNTRNGIEELDPENAPNFLVETLEAVEGVVERLEYEYTKTADGYQS